MNEDWNNYTLEDLISLNKESIKVAEFKDQIYLGLEHVKQNSFALNGIGNAKDVNSNKYIFKSNQVLYGKIRPYFRKVYKPDFSGICSTDFLIFSTKDSEKLNQDYLYSFIRTQEFTDKATEMSSGTKMPRADWSLLKKLEYSFPPVKEQKAIASILSAIDNKIALNLQMNKTLEEMAMTLYKHWFIDFGPFKDGKFVESELGMIPEGWEVIRISDITETTDYVANGSFKSLKENVKTFDTINYALYIRLVDYNNSFKDSLKYVNQSSFEFLSKSQLYGDEVIISNVGANAGTVFRPPKWLRMPMTLGSNSIMIKECPYNEILFQYFKSYLGQNALKNIMTGSAQPKFNKTDFRALRFCLPPVEVCHQIETKLYKIQELIIHNTSENHLLANLRSSLLPKLISGQVRLKEFEKQVSEAL